MLILVVGLIVFAAVWIGGYVIFVVAVFDWVKTGMHIYQKKGE